MAERLPRIGQPLPLIAVPAGRHVLHQGAPITQGLIVVTGALLAYAVDPEGHVAGLDVLGPGDAVGQAGPASHMSARALAPSSLRAAGRAEVAEASMAHAARLSALAQDLAWLDVTSRIERRLDDLAARFGRPVPGGVRIALRLTQDDLAALTGTSRESANRALRRLVRAGRLRRAGPGRYEVRDALNVVGGGNVRGPIAR